MFCKYEDPQVIEDVVNSVKEQRLEDLRFYLIDGADPDQRDRFGLPLLMHAVMQGSKEMAELLLDMGADPNITVASTGHTPLHYAAREKDGGFVGLLHRYGADLEAADHFGWTPLHMAADHGFDTAVQALIEAGASVHARAKDGDTPRTKAERHFTQIRQPEHYRCCQHLLLAERQVGLEVLEHEKAERDIARLKAHNPKRFRLKF